MKAWLVVASRLYVLTIVYNVTKAILKNREKLYEVNKMYTYMKDSKNLTLGVDESLFHPGALKAIKEVQGK